MSLRIISGSKARYIQLRMWIRIAYIAISKIKNPVKIIRAIYNVLQMKKKLVSKAPLRKLISIDNRYFWDLNQPGWPSKAFDQNFKWYLNQFINNKKQNIESVRMVFMAITKKCPMKCTHCYEWGEINKNEVLELKTLKEILQKYQNLGASYFIFGGGEPMARFDDLIELLQSAKPTSDFWISTSGYNLSLEKAYELKKAGLTGVSISIDNHIAHENNQFRGNPKAMDYAIKAAENSLKAGLVLSTAICATKEFISKENMLNYAKFSKEIGAGFIWLIEPRVAGKFANQDVHLSKEHYNILDDFYISVNNNKSFLDFPRVVFPNYNHRHIGCAGAGKGNIMIDTDGYINPCPFCRKKIAFALSDNTKGEVLKMRKTGCFKYKTRFIS